MRNSSTMKSGVPVRFALLAATLAGSLAQAALPSLGAGADPEAFRIAVGNGQIAVKTQGEWHVDVHYPWKVLAGTARFDKSKFVFTPNSARVWGVPRGPAKLRGSVCSGSVCVPFGRTLVVR
jgi:hypothetical protein